MSLPVHCDCLVHQIMNFAYKLPIRHKISKTVVSRPPEHSKAPISGYSQLYIIRCSVHLPCMSTKWIVNLGCSIFIHSIFSISELNLQIKAPISQWYLFDTKTYLTRINVTNYVLHPQHYINFIISIHCLPSITLHDLAERKFCIKNFLFSKYFPKCQ